MKNTRFSKEWIIATLQQLISTAEDNALQYGENPSDNEEVINGKKMLEVLTSKIIKSPRLVLTDINEISFEHNHNPESIRFGFEINVVSNGNFSNYSNDGIIDKKKLITAILSGEIQLSAI